MPEFLEVAAMVDQLAAQYEPDYYDENDIKQQIWLWAIEALRRPTPPQDLYKHCRNRIIGFLRNEWGRERMPFRRRT